MRWEQGRTEIERALASGALQRVPASREHADRLLNQARRHLHSAGQTAQDDPAGAYSLLYDAARKALVAVLENQGLRPTSRGGHLAAYEAVTAQLGSMANMVRPFNRLRRTRNEAEYPSSDTPDLSADDVLEDLPKVGPLLEMAERLLDQMSVF